LRRRSKGKKEKNCKTENIGTWPKSAPFLEERWSRGVRRVGKSFLPVSNKRTAGRSGERKHALAPAEG